MVLKDETTKENKKANQKTDSEKSTKSNKSDNIGLEEGNTSRPGTSDHDQADSETDCRKQVEEIQAQDVKPKVEAFKSKQSELEAETIPPEPEPEPEKEDNGGKFWKMLTRFDFWNYM